MIQIFQGGDPHYQEQYDDINKMLQSEYRINLSKPVESDIYIYWCNKEYFARGGVRLSLCPNSHHYILKNIVCEVDFNLYTRELEDDDYHPYIEQMGLQFYKAIYLKLYDMVKTQAVTLDNSSNVTKQTDVNNQYHRQELAFTTLSKTHLQMELKEDELDDCIRYGCWPCDQGKTTNEIQYLSKLPLRPQDRNTYLKNLTKYQADLDEGEGD